MVTADRERVTVTSWAAATPDVSGQQLLDPAPPYWDTRVATPPRGAPAVRPRRFQVSVSRGRDNYTRLKHAASLPIAARLDQSAQAALAPT
jgi:hypothetical protein